MKKSALATMLSAAVICVGMSASASAQDATPSTGTASSSG